MPLTRITGIPPPPRPRAEPVCALIWAMRSVIEVTPSAAIACSSSWSSGACSTSSWPRMRLPLTMIWSPETAVPLALSGSSSSACCGTATGWGWVVSVTLASSGMAAARLIAQVPARKAARESGERFMVSLQITKIVSGRLLPVPGIRSRNAVRPQTLRVSSDPRPESDIARPLKLEPSLLVPASLKRA